MPRPGSSRRPSVKVLQFQKTGDGRRTKGFIKYFFLCLTILGRWSRVRAGLQFPVLGTAEFESGPPNLLFFFAIFLPSFFFSRFFFWATWKEAPSVTKRDT